MLLFPTPGFPPAFGVLCLPVTLITKWLKCMAHVTGTSFLDNRVGLLPHSPFPEWGSRQQLSENEWGEQGVSPVGWLTEERQPAGWASIEFPVSGALFSAGQGLECISSSKRVALHVFYFCLLAFWGSSALPKAVLSLLSESNIRTRSFLHVEHLLYLEDNYPGLILGTQASGSQAPFWISTSLCPVISFYKFELHCFTNYIYIHMPLTLFSERHF